MPSAPSGRTAARGTADLDALFDQVAARARQREAEREAAAGLWLSHHHPQDYDRCMVVRGRRVCRRCLVLHPLAFSVALLTLAGGSLWPEALDPWLIWGLCIPATVDFAAEQFGLVRYSARRQVVVSALVALAYGRGLGIELDDRWQPLFWGPVLVFCTLWFVLALAGRAVRRRGSTAR